MRHKINKPLKSSRSSNTSDSFCGRLAQEHIVDRLNSEPAAFYYPKETYLSDFNSSMVFLIKWVCENLLFTSLEYACWLVVIS